MTDDLVKRARLAQRDDRMASGALYGNLAERIEALEAENARLREALTGIRRLARLVANDLQGRVESGKVAAVQNCADIADAALTGEKGND